MHCRGPAADHVLARRQDQTTETAPGKSTRKTKRIADFLPRPLSTGLSRKILFCFSSLTGPKHDPVNPESGPEDPERPAVCAENGSSAEGPGNQVQTGGGEPQAEHRQAIQGTDKSLSLEKTIGLLRPLPNTLRL